MESATSKKELEERLKEGDSEWWSNTLTTVNQENVYTCDTCKKYIVTIDVDRGTTPMLIKCRDEKCEGTMTSHFYPPMEHKPDIVPDAWWEWYRPEVIDESDEHLMKGGLLLRERLKNG